jgi:tight adherence protein B
MPEFVRMIDLVVVGSVFVLILAAWLVGLCIWSLRRARYRPVEERLRASHEQCPTRVLRLWHEGRPIETRVAGKRRLSLLQRLEQLREQAGWEAPFGSVALGVLGSVLLVFVVSFVLTGMPLAAAGAGLAVLVCIWVYAKHRIARRTAHFEQQLVDALELAARSLRAGHPLVGAFRLISEEIASPIGTVFGRICQEQALGVGLEDAVTRAAEESSSDDLRLFATSVNIQLRSGGNLADMMERVAAVMRDRIRLNRRVRVLTAQGQLSKRILLILPFLLFVVFNLIRPGYMRPLYHSTIGHILLAITAFNMLLGAWVMNRLLILRY